MTYHPDVAVLLQDVQVLHVLVLEGLLAEGALERAVQCPAVELREDAAIADVVRGLLVVQGGGQLDAVLQRDVHFGRHFVVEDLVRAQIAPVVAALARMLAFEMDLKKREN